MKYIKQLAIILGISLLGEVLHGVLPLPVPASIYGLVLLLAALMTGILKLEQIEATADFLVQVMPLMFIPAAVGLMDSFAVLRPVLLPVLAIVLISTAVVLGVTGRVTQALLKTGKQVRK